MGRFCAYPGCNSKMRNTSTLSFHRLPFSNVDVLKLWLVALKMDEDISVQELRRLDYRVCSVHFAAEDFFPLKEITAGRRFQRAILRKNAVPIVADECRKTTKMSADDDQSNVTGVPEIVHSIDEVDDYIDESSSDQGDMDSEEEWDPEQVFEELQSNSEEENFADEDIAPKHKELCSDCGKLCDKRNHVCEHKIKPYSCNHCGKRFMRKSGLKFHGRIHDGSFNYSCKYCHIKFKTKVDKVGHEQSHPVEEKPYRCPDCSETFSTYKACQLHVAEDHRGQTQLKCHICGLQFSRINVFQRHMIVHTGEKPFSCVVCHRGFNQSGHLTSHMRLHTGERPYKCQHCDKCFNHNVSLKSHVQRHHASNSGDKQEGISKTEQESGDAEANRNKAGEDLPGMIEEQLDTDDFQMRRSSQYKRKEKSSGRPRGRPRKNAADSVQIGQSSNTKTAEIKVSKRTRSKKMRKSSLKEQEG